MLKSNPFQLALIALVIVSFLCKQYNATEIAQCPVDAIEEAVQIVYHVMFEEKQGNGTSQEILDQKITFLDPNNHSQSNYNTIIGVEKCFFMAYSVLKMA